MLAAQVRRMMADARARRWSTILPVSGSCWDIRDAAPDPDLFPDFDENLREAFQRETELFIESQIRDDKSVPELLTANYTFLNERLARHYGIAGA